MNLLLIVAPLLMSAPLAARYNQRRKTDSKDDPTANCIVGGVPRPDLEIQ